MIRSSEISKVNFTAFETSELGFVLSFSRTMISKKHFPSLHMFAVYIFKSVWIWFKFFSKSFLTQQTRITIRDVICNCSHRFNKIRIVCMFVCIRSIKCKFKLNNLNQLTLTWRIEMKIWNLNWWQFNQESKRKFVGYGSRILSNIYRTFFCPYPPQHTLIF